MAGHMSKMNTHHRPQIFSRGLAVMLLVAYSTTPLALELSDPTRPPQVQKPVKPSSNKPKAPTPIYALQSTLITPHTRMAVINGQSVTVGATLQGATVIDIAFAAVRLRREGREFEVKLMALQDEDP